MKKRKIYMVVYIAVVLLEFYFIKAVHTLKGI